MYAQRRLTASVRGTAELPITAANVADGVIGFMKAAFGLRLVFAFLAFGAAAFLVATFFVATFLVAAFLVVVFALAGAFFFVVFLVAKVITSR